MTLPAKQTEDEAIEAALIDGDLAKLSTRQRVTYYNRTCESMGLNPLTKPFGYITLNGKLTLYALRACTDQLRTLKSISLQIMSRDVLEGILTVHVRATMPDGRHDEDLGTVPFPDTLKGDARANAELKAITKAKRRVTLSICGLGWLDETEVETIPGARKPKEPAPNAMIPHDPHTGEITESAAPAQDKPAADTAPEPPNNSGAALSLEDMAREAAMRGAETFKAFYKARSGAEKMILNSMGDELRGLMGEASG